MACALWQDVDSSALKYIRMRTKENEFIVAPGALRGIATRCCAAAQPAAGASRGGVLRRQGLTGVRVQCHVRRAAGDGVTLVVVQTPHSKKKEPDAKKEEEA